MAQDSQHNRSKINDSTDTDTGQSLGNYLQRERIKKQFSLEEVAEQTCINIGTLRAIESNDRGKMPAEVFSRGFIKLYAKFLGLDQQEVLERYDREMAQSDEENIRNHDVFYNEKLAESSSFFSLRKMFYLLMLLALIALGYYFFLSSESPTSRHSSRSGNQSLSSQINEKFEAAQTPSQTQYHSPAPTEGDTYAPATAPVADNLPSAGSDSKTQETTSPGANYEQSPPPAASPQVQESSTASAPPASVEKQEAPPPAQ